MNHRLKIDPYYFAEVLAGRKTFEVRLNDRNFLHRDTIELHEWAQGKYTGRFVMAKITFLMCGGHYGISPEYVVFSFKITNTFP